MKKSIKYIFGILLSSVLLTVGCGSSSSNNPVSTGNINSGIVNVKGNVTNLTGNGTVAFYPPSVAVKNSLNKNQSNTFRASVSNDGVYTFNVDEKGNYAGQVPAGDYYVIAQNADGSMKSVSAKLRLASDIATYTNEVNVELRKTYPVKGQLIIDSSPNISAKNQIVYIENMPFVTVTTDDNGNFTFEAVPASSSYTICADVWVNNYRYHFSETVEVPSELTIDLSDNEAISISGDSTKGNLNNNAENVTVILGNEFYTVNVNNKEFTLPLKINSSNLSDCIFIVDTATLIEESNVTFSDNSISINYVPSDGSSDLNDNYVIKIKNDNIIALRRGTNGSNGADEIALRLYKLDDNGSCKLFYSEMIYDYQLEADNLCVTVTDKGNYFCVITGKNNKDNTYGLSFSGQFNVPDKITGTIEPAINILIYKPIATVSNYIYKFNSDIIWTELNKAIDSYVKTIDDNNIIIIKPIACFCEAGYTKYKKVDLKNDTDPVDFASIINAESSNLESSNLESSNLESSYSVKLGYSFYFKNNQNSDENGDLIDEFTSDPYPYVKHNEVSETVNGGQ